ncbi:MAG: DUF2934 domain-containing protein [Phycisphaerae bacterium]
MARERNENKRKLTPAPANLPMNHSAAQAQPGDACATREQLIRHRAFELFEHRIHLGIPGDPDADWLQAEREVDDRPAADCVQGRDLSREESRR